MKTLKEYEEEYEKWRIEDQVDCGMVALQRIQYKYRQAINEILEEVVGGFQENECSEDFVYGYNAAKAEIRERIAKIIK